MQRLAAARSQLAGLQSELPALRKAASQSTAKRLESWWASNHRKVYVAGGLVASVIVWRSMFYVASSFLSLSESVAEAGFLALALGLVLAVGTFVTWRRRLDPETVYRRAWAQLTANEAVFRALGAPLVHTETRAFVLSGGGLKIKNWRPRLRSRRCHLLFPMSGPQGRAIVSAEAKREKGKYVFKLLAIDVAPPAQGGREARLYLAGDEAIYNSTKILAELRDPLIAQLQAEPMLEAQEEEELLLEEGGAAEDGEAVAAKPKAQAQPQAADGGEDLYAWDYFTAWLAKKRTAEAAEAGRK